MKNKKTILKDWNQNGYVNISFFTKEQISDIKREGKRLLIERDSNWDKHGLEGSQPYRLPHTESVIFEKLMKDKRIHEIVKLFICNDNNISECDLQVTQTWMYFKPPGELGDMGAIEGLLRVDGKTPLLGVRVGEGCSMDGERETGGEV